MIINPLAIMSSEVSQSPIPLLLILPTHNRPAFLERALNSIINQTYLNYHLVICDNSSDDSSVSVCRPYICNNIEYRRTGNDMPASEHFIKILEVMDEYEYNYFSIFHDDDEMLPDHLESSMQIIANHPVGMVASAAHIINENSTILRTDFYPSDITTIGISGVLTRCYRSPFCTPTIIYRKGVKYDADFQSVLGLSDYALHIYNVYKFGAVIKARPTYKYRLHDTNDYKSYSNVNSLHRRARVLAIRALRLNYGIGYAIRFYFWLRDVYGFLAYRLSLVFN